MQKFEKIISVRADERWVSWLADLADQAGRSQGAMLRDMVFCVTVTSIKEPLLSLLKEGDLSYSEFAGRFRGQ